MLVIDQPDTFFPFVNAQLIGETVRHPMIQDLKAVEHYHESTKHHLERYARSLGYLDWANQPDPFREYAGAPRFELPLAQSDDTPLFRTLFDNTSICGRALNLSTIGLFLELSLALSAWKQTGTSRWALRINPSSGNLHPTEGYLILPPISGLGGKPGVYHYLSRDHVLEQRALWRTTEDLYASGFYVVLTSILWREVWKYGERAFRYCQHDIGHALAALRVAAASLGWRIHLHWRWTTSSLARVLGLDRSQDFVDAEREVPELIAWVSTENFPESPNEPDYEGDRISVGEDGSPVIKVPDKTEISPESIVWFGQANRLSREHADWPIIEEVAKATAQWAFNIPLFNQESAAIWPKPLELASTLQAGQVIRQRRSAVAFDGVTQMEVAQFLQLLSLTLPHPSQPPFDVGLGPTRAHLVLFVHRVTDLPPGLYFWLRDANELESLKKACHPEFEWRPIITEAHSQSLFRLALTDTQDFARTVSCHQDIAADSAFSLGMLVRFHQPLEQGGPSLYRHLFWESGMIGQMLYLGAEALGYRATGIGCFFDDVLHQALGLKDQTYQSLYHFTVGGPVEDPRLQTNPPYFARVPAKTF